MTMTPYSTDITRPLKWMQNNAPRVQALIKQKASWYNRYNAQFWTNWETNVFDIRTANGFGLTVWCIILGVPPSLFSLATEPDSWAFGKYRQNYLDSGGRVGAIDFIDGPHLYANSTLVPGANYTYLSASNQVTFTAAPALNTILSWRGTIAVPNNPSQQLIVQQPRIFGVGDGATKAFALAPMTGGTGNEIGGNFYGGGTKTISLLNEARQILQLRYCALVSNGQLAWINHMLAYIFNDGKKWDMTTKRYFYVTDLTQGASPNASPAPTKKLYMEYRVGSGLPVSAQFINTLNTQAYGIMPTIAGVGYLVVQES